MPFVIKKSVEFPGGVILKPRDLWAQSRPTQVYARIPTCFSETRKNHLPHRVERLPRKTFPNYCCWHPNTRGNLLDNIGLGGWRMIHGQSLDKTSNDAQCSTLSIRQTLCPSTRSCTLTREIWMLCYGPTLGRWAHEGKLALEECPIKMYPVGWLEGGMWERKAMVEPWGAQ